MVVSTLRAAGTFAAKSMATRAGQEPSAAVRAALGGEEAFATVFKSLPRSRGSRLPKERSAKGCRRSQTRVLGLAAKPPALPHVLRTALCRLSGGLAVNRAFACSARLARSCASVALLLPGTALAQDAPAERTGLQLDVRSGVSIPFGKATPAPDDALSGRYGKQVPILFGIGGKFSPAVYLGGYFGFSIGGPGSSSELQALCDSPDTEECSAVTARFGIETRYYFAPEAVWDPWLAYGLGFEGSTLGIDREGERDYTTLTGFELASNRRGLDWRGSKVFGIGAYFETSLGTFISERRSERPRDDRSRLRRGHHGWATPGYAAPVFPLTHLAEIAAQLAGSGWRRGNPEMHLQQGLRSRTSERRPLPGRVQEQEHLEWS